MSEAKPGNRWNTPPFAALKAGYEISSNRFLKLFL
jgi:hypothetical protein